MKYGPALWLMALLAVGAGPTPTYIIQGKPSEVVQDRPAMIALARQVTSNLRTETEKDGPKDPAAVARGYRTLLNAALLIRDHAAARRYTEQIREMQPDGPGRLALGLVTGAFMQAADDPGPDFRGTFRATLTARLKVLPLGDVGPALEALLAALDGLSKRGLIDAVVDGLDPLAKDGTIGQDVADALVATAMNLEILLPVKDDAILCLKRALDSGAAPGASSARIGHPTVGRVTTRLTGAYFGQTRPGETPVPFAPEVLASLNPWTEGFSFSPDGTVCFVSIGDATYSRSWLYMSTLANGAWTLPVEAPFLSGFEFATLATFSADGRSIVFGGRKGSGLPDLWSVSASGRGWRVPVALPTPINSDLGEYPGSNAADGTMYFSRTRAGLQSRIYTARGGVTGAPTVELVGPPISLDGFDGDPAIAPDGHFLVFYSARPGGRGGTDLYVSFRDGNGGWRPPVNLGPDFNSPDDEYGAHLSPDAKYLFFTRHTAVGNRIFWVAASAIERLEG